MPTRNSHTLNKHQKAGLNCVPSLSAILAFSVVSLLTIGCWVTDYKQLSTQIGSNQPDPTVSTQRFGLPLLWNVEVTVF